MNEHYNPPVDLEFLSSLGFGPDSPLMNDPRLLVDGRFLGVVLVELDDELGAECAQAVFYQIGFYHGMRDGHRLVAQKLAGDSGVGQLAHPEATPLAIELGPRRADSATGCIEISGAWPESYESEVRLGKLGPATAPSCWLSAGYTAGWLSACFDGDMVVVETECTVRGDARCRFVSQEVAAGPTSADVSNAVQMDSRSFGAFRAAAMEVDDAPAGTEDSPLDMGEPAVHIWGPVMVLPFTDVEQALCTIEMLGREADTTEIRAVVLDLRSAPLDEGYGAVALEQVLECIEAWGAEAILTGVGNLAEGVVSELETARLLIRKDVCEAIAVAFQIADVQRHPL